MWPGTTMWRGFGYFYWWSKFNLTTPTTKTATTTSSSATSHTFHPTTSHITNPPSNHSYFMVIVKMTIAVVNWSASCDGNGGVIEHEQEHSIKEIDWLNFGLRKSFEQAQNTHTRTHDQCIHRNIRKLNLQWQEEKKRKKKNANQRNNFTLKIGMNVWNLSRKTKWTIQNINGEMAKKARIFCLHSISNNPNSNSSKNICWKATSNLFESWKFWIRQLFYFKEWFFDMEVHNDTWSENCFRQKEL